jgi:hypothetical protein
MQQSSTMPYRKTKGAQMKRILSTLALAAFLTGTAGNFANAQNEPRITQSDGRTFLDSDIRIGADYPPIAGKTFTSAPVVPLRKGAVLPSRGLIGVQGMDRMLSVRQHDFAIGPRTVKYPVIALMRCSNFPDTGSFVKVIASTTTFNVALKAGEVLHSGAYRIEATRAIHAGETVPTLRVVFGENVFILSIEGAQEAKNQADAALLQPRLTIVNEHAKPGDRDIAIEAWRKSNQSVTEGILKGLQ